MFGLSDKDKHQKNSSSFELEREIQEDPQLLRRYEDRVKMKLERLKTFPQAAGALSKDNALAVIRSGYESLLKVLSRINTLGKR